MVKILNKWKPNVGVVETEAFLYPGSASRIVQASHKGCLITCIDILNMQTVWPSHYTPKKKHIFERVFKDFYFSHPFDSKTSRKQLQYILISKGLKYGALIENMMQWFKGVMYYTHWQEKMAQYYIKWRGRLPDR